MTRIWHHWEKWECVPAGMYETTPPTWMTPEDAETAYERFLRDLSKFEQAIIRVFYEWPFSCDQFLTNGSLNRIAWIGQSSMCIATGVPACFRSGFRLLKKREQNKADDLAEKYLNLWIDMREKVTKYLATWGKQGYPNGIPDEVPGELMRLKLAPSYKAIAHAILKNDHALASLGFTPPVSPWYNAIKRVEIEARNKPPVTMGDPMF